MNPEPTQTPRHSVSVAGILTDDCGRALLICRRDNQHWEPPGGILELGESIHDGLRREVREETGLEVEPIALTGIYKNMARAIVSLVFRCKTTGGMLTTNDEASGFRWAAETEVAGLMDEAFAIRVLDALHDVTTVAIRLHDGVRLLAGAGSAPG
jgi:ADP-ribose pyrophosphatase YjhB (NUDIX family)